MLKIVFERETVELAGSRDDLIALATTITQSAAQGMTAPMEQRVQVYPGRFVTLIFRQGESVAAL